MYAVIEIDTKENYRGTIEKANVLVTAFGTDLNYIENQAAKGTELKIKKEPDSRGIDPSNRRYDIDESNSETGDVPSPKTNIPQNGNGVNTLAIRAVSNPKWSQIYNWGIKNDTSLGGVGHTPFGSNSNGTSSDVSKANIPQNGNAVNNKKQSNFEKTVQKKAPGVFAPGAFVQLLKVKELFLAFHFCIALAAINRTILSGFERNFCFAAAGSAGGGVHFFLGFDFVFACIAALFATLGLVNEAALCIEFLFAGGESELFSAFFAH